MDSIGAVPVYSLSNCYQSKKSIKASEIIPDIEEEQLWN